MSDMLFKRIKDWVVSITSFRSGDVIPVDGPSGTAKMAKDDMLKETAQNALAGNVAPAFDPTKPNDVGGYAYYAGTNVTYEGKNYVFRVNHSSGAWNSNEVEQKPFSESMDTEGVGEAVANWLNEHPEATTTVQDDSLTEVKFSDALKLQTIKDYVTPEMFGAIGDGVTDDTAAFTAMVAASSKYILTKNYVVSGFIINKTFELVGLTGCSLIANNNEQEYIIRIDSGNKNYIRGVIFNGKGSITPGQRGNVVGVLLNASSTSELTIDFCNFNLCKIGLFAPKTFWHSKVSMCRFNWCEYGISIGQPSGPANATYLELLFSMVYCNQCDTDLYVDYGSNIEFSNCSFGNENVPAGSRFFNNRYAIRNLLFKSCNFEGCYVKGSTGAFRIEGGSIVSFQNCIFHVINPVEEVDPSNVSLFEMWLGSGNKIIFEMCRFASITVNYMLNCTTGTKQTYIIDYYTLSSASDAFPRKFDAKSVYSTSNHSFNISDIVLVDNIPISQPWATTLNNFFKGTIFRIRNTTELYMWDGSAWVKLVYVPQPPSDENTYTLKNVAGVLTWVQDL